MHSFLAPSTKAGFHSCGRFGEECGLERQRLRESFSKGIPQSVFSFIARLFVGGFRPNLISKCACENEHLHSKLQTMNLRQSRTYQYFTSLHPVTIITSFFLKKGNFSVDLSIGSSSSCVFLLFTYVWPLVVFTSKFCQ